MRSKVINSLAALVIAAGSTLMAAPSQAQHVPPRDACCETSSCGCCGTYASCGPSGCSCS
jgi:hypothetical protein